MHFVLLYSVAKKKNQKRVIHFESLRISSSSLKIVPLYKLNKSGDMLTALSYPTFNLCITVCSIMKSNSCLLVSDHFITFVVDFNLLQDLEEFFCVWLYEMPFDSQLRQGTRHLDVE